MSKLILVVEDNGDDQLFILANLKRPEHYSVVCVPDGASARQLLEDPSQPLPEVVILDLSLPKVSGLDLLRSIRANTRTKFLPVVILSSSKETEDIQGAFELGCNSYLHKPIAYEEFRETINQISDYWCLRNISPYAMEIAGHTPHAGGSGEPPFRKAREG